MLKVGDRVTWRSLVGQGLGTVTEVAERVMWVRSDHQSAEESPMVFVNEEREALQKVEGPCTPFGTPPPWSVRSKVEEK